MKVALIWYNVDMYYIRATAIQNFRFLLLFQITKPHIFTEFKHNLTLPLWFFILIFVESCPFRIKNKHGCVGASRTQIFMTG